MRSLLYFYINPITTPHVPLHILSVVNLRPGQNRHTSYPSEFPVYNNTIIDCIKLHPKPWGQVQRFVIACETP